MHSLGFTKLHSVILSTAVSSIDLSGTSNNAIWIVCVFQRKVLWLNPTRIWNFLVSFAHLMARGRSLVGDGYHLLWAVYIDLPCAPITEAMGHFWASGLTDHWDGEGRVNFHTFKWVLFSHWIKYLQKLLGAMICLDSEWVYVRAEPWGYKCDVSFLEFKSGCSLQPVHSSVCAYKLKQQSLVQGTVCQHQEIPVSHVRSLFPRVPSILQ